MGGGSYRCIPLPPTVRTGEPLDVSLKNSQIEVLDIQPIRGVYRVYTPSKVVYVIETITQYCVNCSGTTCKLFWYSMQVLCKLIFIYQNKVYDSLYSAVHPMKYLESDVMWYKTRYTRVFINVQVVCTQRLSRLFMNTLIGVGCSRFRLP